MVALSDIFNSLGRLELPAFDAPASAGQRRTAAVQLGRILEADFDAAAETLAQRGGQAVDRRALVRCFGSLIDGLANVLCTIARSVCAAEGRENNLLHEKSADPGTAILPRICTSYRIITRCLRASPLTSLQAQRWDDLRAALDIRNRVAHPQTPSDLEICESNIRLLTQVARQFIQDFEALAQWQAACAPPATVRPTSSPTRRNRNRGGLRHRKCPCGSGRKYKSCCRLAQLAA